MTTIDEIPLPQLCGTCVVLDLYQKEEFGVITAVDLAAARPEIKLGDRVILNTGWHRYHGADDEKFMLRYPGLDRSAVDWFVEMQVSWVGSDTPSPDHAFALRGLISKYRPDVFTGIEIDAEAFPPAYCHKTLLANNIPMLEQLGGQIDEVTGERVEVIALPPKYKYSEAAQIRVIVMKED